MKSVIKLENVSKFIGEDLGEDVKVVELAYGKNKIKVIVKQDVMPVSSHFDEEEGIIILNNKNEDIMEEVYCLLFDEDFIDSEMTLISLEGAQNGCLVLDDESSIYAVPELEANAANLEMSHEAAVGQIDEEEIYYLTSRGLTEEQAASMIVRGFLSMDIVGLPDELAAETQKMIDMSLEGM